jgi:DNA-binding YbaB/EbfC family protein
MLKGLGGLGDMAKIMKQAQEMQGKIADAQAALENIEVTGESGAGMVTCTANAKGELKGLNIDPSLFNADDKEVVEDLILAAIKDVQIKANEAMQAGMAEATAGIKLPEGMNFPGM